MKLIPFTEKVLNKLYQWNCDADMRKNICGTSVESSFEDIKIHYTYAYDGKSGTILAVELDTGEIVGAFLLERIELRHKRGWVHVLFEPGNERHILEGTHKFLNFMFIENDFKMLLAAIPEKNTKVKKYMEKVGFKRKCIIPDYFLLQQGWEHGVIYTLKKTERKI